MTNASRRRFLNRVTLAVGAIAAGSPFVSAATEGEGDDEHVWRGVRRRVKPGRPFFPQGVASFDPRSESIVLWARVSDAAYPGQNLRLTLLIGTDLWLRRIVVAEDIPAYAQDDGVVQVKVTGLKAGRHYWYRFVYERDGSWFGSPLGRTKTAPLPQDTAPVRFALANCQDVTGRYYNTYLPLIPQEVDLVVHVGDYIYETNGDPSFQETGGRRPVFSDLGGAIALKGANGQSYYAAASVSNYRELYQFYRADPVLQQMHRRFAFVNIWDDHEYSDDCHGATSTYFDGREEEFDMQRRRNAERVFFEYVGVDDDTLPGGVVDVDARPLYPDARLYREIRYGKNLHLVLTDSRSFRPDHLIPEDGFPGTVVVDRAGLTALLGAQGIPYDAAKGKFAPYFDIDLPAYAAYRDILTKVLFAAYASEYLARHPAAQAQANALAKTAATVRGPLDASVVNSLLAANVPGFPLIDITGLDRGISYALMGKAALFSSLGARYFVVKDTYDLYAAYRSLLLGDRNAENVYGDVQRRWLEDILRGSDALWKVVANSTSLTSMVLDLTGNLEGLPEAIKGVLAQLPPLLRNRFYLNVDQFDGFPNFKRGLLDLFNSVDGVALVAGDIHAAFATEHPNEIWEYTAPAVSSAVFRNGVLSAVLSDPTLSQIPGLAALVSQLDTLLALANKQIRHVDTAVNGVVVVEAGAQRMKATYWQAAGDLATTSYYHSPLAFATKLKVKHFEVRAQGPAA
jgi:alkaline phosphatase D